MLNLSRYVHLNPVKGSAGRKVPIKARAEALRAYAWSSFRGYAGLERPWDFVDEGPLLAMMPVVPARRRSAYARFVQDGLAIPENDWPSIEQVRWGWGDDTFLAQIQHAHESECKRYSRAEDVSFRHVANRMDPEEVLRWVSREFEVSVADLKRRGYRNQARAAALMMLHRHSALSQRDVGELLKAGTGAAVSQRLAALRRDMAADPKLARRIESLSEAIGRGKS